MSTTRATLSNRQSIDDNVMGAVVGLVGCGRWGMTHLKTLNTLKNKGLISAIHACDIDPLTKSEAIKYADTFCTDWQTLVSNHELDAVAIVTPVDTHHDLALSILDFCQALFIEKPIGLTEKEASSIIAKAQETGSKLLVGHILRFHEAINEAMSLISCGEIGELQRIEFNRITTRQPPNNPNIFEAMAIHGIDTACYCFGELEPSRLTVSNVILNDSNYPINAKLSIEYPGMKEACIDVGWNGNEENREIRYFGSNGSITVETGSSSSLTINKAASESIRSFTASELPLTKEWLYLLESSENYLHQSIYPQQGAIIRSVKWVEFANQEIQNTSTELNESIE